MAERRPPAAKRTLTLPGQVVTVQSATWDPDEGAWTVTLRVAALHWDAKSLCAAVESVCSNAPPTGSIRSEKKRRRRTEAA